MTKSPSHSRSGFGRNGLSALDRALMLDSQRHLQSALPTCSVPLLRNSNHYISKSVAVVPGGKRGCRGGDICRLSVASAAIERHIIVSVDGRGPPSGLPRRPENSERHEVRAKMFFDPDLGQEVIVLVQTDVTGKVCVRVPGGGGGGLKGHVGNVHTLVFGYVLSSGTCSLLF